MNDTKPIAIKPIANTIPPIKLGPSKCLSFLGTGAGVGLAGVVPGCWVGFVTGVVDSGSVTVVGSVVDEVVVSLVVGLVVDSVVGLVVGFGVVETTEVGAFVVVTIDDSVALNVVGSVKRLIQDIETNIIISFVRSCNAKVWHDSLYLFKPTRKYFAINSYLKLARRNRKEWKIN